MRQLTESLISDEVKESEVEMGGICGNERKNWEVGGEVENCEMEDSDMGENKPEENDTGESDHCEECN